MLKPRKLHPERILDNKHCLISSEEQVYKTGDGKHHRKSYNSGLERSLGGLSPSTALSEGPSSVPSTRFRLCTTACNSSSWVTTSSSRLCGHPHACTHPRVHIWIRISHNKTILYNKKEVGCISLESQTAKQNGWPMGKESWQISHVIALHDLCWWPCFLMVLTSRCRRRGLWHRVVLVNPLPSPGIVSAWTESL